MQELAPKGVRGHGNENCYSSFVEMEKRMTWRERELQGITRCSPETALQGTLVLAKSGLELGDNILRIL